MKELLLDFKSKEYNGMCHGSTMIVCNSVAESTAFLIWADENGFRGQDYMYTNKEFPYCLQIGISEYDLPYQNGSVGWTKSMDRALNYFPFKEFHDKFL